MKHAALSLVLLAGMAVSSSVTSGQGRWSRVSMRVNFRQSPGHVYTAPPMRRSVLMFFSGEPIEFKIELDNGGSDVRVIASPDLASNFTLNTLLGDRFDVALDPDVKLRTPFGERPVDWMPEMVLGENEQLIIHGEVTTRLPPGEHAASFSTTIRDSDGSSLNPHATRLQFEVRERSADTKIEELRRSAFRATLADDYPAAERWIDTLLQLHPRSYEAYVMRGYIAERRQDRVRARAAYQQAVDLLQSQSDEKYLPFFQPILTEHTISGLRQKILFLSDSSPVR